MQGKYWKKLETCLSPDRLAAYGQDSPGYRTVTARYLWNIALCESLYAPIHFLEIGLRNAIDQSMSAETGAPNWYDIISLTSWGHAQIGNAKSGISRAKKPVMPGRVIAELNFGFWTAMFESHFEKPAARFLPKGIKTTFPHMPKTRPNRKAIKADLDKIRTLRNRIFHHERIIHWKDLDQQHQLILDFLGWINPDLAELTSIIDTFTTVHQNGIQPYLQRLDTHISQLTTP